MDQKNQKKVMELSEKYDAQNIVVILGNSESETAGLNAETVTAGDPTDIGPLAGVSLGLAVYHIFELKDKVEANIYDEQCGVMEMILDVDAIKKEVKSIRDKYSKY
jgi:hypothetical protein